MRRVLAVVLLAIVMGSGSACGNGDEPPGESTKDGTLMIDDRIAIQMSVGTWAGIDAGMDNVNQGAIEDGEDEVASQASDIREAGWDQVTMVDGDWPPADQVVTVSLTRSQWMLVLSDAKESISAYGEIDDQESVDLGRRALAAIEPHLG